jgi:phage terminase large subunit GpA-like protein
MSASPIVLEPRVVAAYMEAAKVFTPPPLESISAWADGKFVLSTEDTVAAGSIQLDVTPYLREMLDALLDPRAHEFVYWTGAQLGKTTVLKILLAYYIERDPSPILYMMPTLQMAKKWSRVRLASMIRDNPGLRALFSDAARTSSNAILFKTFPGGWLNVVGANSASEMSSWPMRIVLADEEDRYPLSAGSEGDPVTLAAERTDTYEAFAKIVHASTCTLEGLSRIQAKYAISDQRKWWMPCPHCGEYQQLRWSRMVKDDMPPHEGTIYPCGACAAVIDESHKRWMLARGQWRADRPEVHNVVGFWMNSLNSPFVSWAKLAEKWFAALHHREDREKLKTFYNLTLAKTWKDGGEQPEGTELLKRRENYGRPPDSPEAPDGVIVVTAAVDVQADRLEFAAEGWGRGEENWGIDHQVFSGDTEKPEVWDKLAEYLRGRRYLHARGIRLEIAATFIDSGYLAAEVYKFARKMQSEGVRLWPSKGISPSFGKPPLGNISKSNRHRVRFYPVSVDVIKETVYARLKIKDPRPENLQARNGEAVGAGYMHFSAAIHTKEYFDQLTAETLAKETTKNGFPVRVWKKPPGVANEALDLKVYAYAAFLSLSMNPKKMLEALERDLQKRAREAAVLRREKHPGQLALLESSQYPVPGDGDEVQASAGESSAVSRPSSDVLPAAPSADVEPGLGANEFKVATDDPGQQEPEAPRPLRVKVRRSWI